MFILVPSQVKVAEHLARLKAFPPARGSSLRLGKILDAIQYAKPVTRSSSIGTLNQTFQCCDSSPNSPEAETQRQPRWR
jgi:hypothetical protein